MYMCVCEFSPESNGSIAGSRSLHRVLVCTHIFAYHLLREPTQVYEADRRRNK